MKKLILILCMLCATTVYAQHFYVNGNIGYMFSIAGQSFPKISNNNTDTYDKASLAKGIGPLISAGYMFNKNIGVELGIRYMAGSYVKYTS